MAKNDKTGDPVTSLLSWHAKLRPRKVDIAGDFAGKELFVVHGDSLLLHCVAKAKVDYGDGFQLLHAIYEVEKFLSNLKERGCNFDIIFFRNHASLSVPAGVSTEKDYKYRLTRAVLIEHLSHAFPSQSELAEPEVFIGRFDTPESPEFKKYLSEHAVHFFLCHEGYENGPQQTTVAFQSLIYQLVSDGYHVAVINDLEFKDSKMFASLIGGDASLPILSFEQLAAQESGSGEPTALLQTILKDNSTKFSVREIITMAGLSKLLEDDTSADVQLRAKALLIHTCILRECSLSDRACKSVTSTRSSSEQVLDNQFLREFSEAAIQVVDGISQNTAAVSLDWDIYDLLDGRVFASILGRMASDDTFSIPPSVHARVSAISKCMGEVSAKAQIKTLPAIENPAEEKRTTDTTSSPARSIHASVLPFSHPALEKYFESIKLDADKPRSPAPITGKIFAELTHWHSIKKPIDPKKPPKKLGFFAHKRNQKLMADIITYSASLTSASGKIIDPETVVVYGKITQDNEAAAKLKLKPGQSSDPKQKPKASHSSDAKQKPKPALPSDTKQKTNKKEKVMSNKDKALAAAKAIKDQKAEKRGTSAVEHWKSSCQEIEQERSLIKRYMKAWKYVADRPNESLQAIGPEAYLYLSNILIAMWKIYCDKKIKQKGIDLVAMIWEKLLDVSHMPNCTTEVIAAFEMTARLLKLPRVQLDGSAEVSRKLAFRLGIDGESRGLTLPIDTLPFQLEYCGPYMERSFDSQPDPRVPFKPDAWQRRVLDAIDEEQSLFVVAPTSAGKTFISFYAMKKVLQSSDDDILVYVAPTKALVNQIAAEIGARFSKAYNRDGRSVWAIHTRDYRINNPNGCQILVTVPHILQIMLLSPSNAEKPTSWSRRVKRIIFDEVHCIGQAEDGLIWEQLILLAPCPIIALSATVGNEIEFRDWLAATQSVKGFKLETVVHNGRYSDLRKFIYEPPNPKQVTYAAVKKHERLPIPGLDQGEEQNLRFHYAHPIAALLDFNRENLSDITLEPRDCLTLWRSMKKHQTADFPIDESLNPEICLPEIVKKANIIQWEAELKKFLQDWMKSPTSPFSKVRAELLGQLNGVRTAVGELHSGEEHSDSAAKSSYAVTLVPLLYDLHNQDALPVIVFNYDRIECELGIEAVVDHLKAAEQEWKDSTPEWGEKVKEHEKWKKAASKAALKNDKSSTKDKKSSSTGEDGKVSKLEMARVDGNADVSPWARFNPDAPIDRFTFADTSKLSQSDFDEMVWHLDDEKVPAWLIDALRRGLGVHHAGLNRRYRQIVEILFRKGYLRVVMATGTLALGVNMPCKTVVFCGDSVFLTALNYRQASGRAGRRGFDLLGNVVFLGISPERVFEIMSSRLPDLRGHFPISATLILRLFSLLHGTQNSEYAVTALQSLLSLTRLYLGGPEAQLSIKHHVRFSIEYLRRQYLLSEDGKPLNFSGLVSHLYYTENAAFAFHSLLKGGYFHQLSSNIDEKPEKVVLELVLVLSHIFGRIPIQQNSKTWREEVSHGSPSQVFLPPLPQAAEEILLNHNKETLGVFVNYVDSYVKEHLSHKPEHSLPFTKTIVGHKNSSSKKVFDHVPSPTIRSPFVALSKPTDKFNTIHEFCSEVRDGVFLEESAIPYLSVEGHDTDVRFNGYIYDFFKHGDMKAISRDNRIKAGDVWQCLKDFSLVMATIVTSIDNYMKAEESVDDIDMLEVGDAQDAEEQYAEVVVTEAKKPLVEPSAAAAAAPKAKSKKKQVVGDSWDQSDDDTDDSDGDWDAKSEKDSTRPASRESSTQATSWGGEEGGKQSLENVLKAFKTLQEEFDTKFRKVWA